MEALCLVSCSLTGELTTEQVTESHPSWNIMESDHYLLDIRKTKCYTLVYGCPHGHCQHTVRKIEPEIVSCRIRDAWLHTPVEYVRHVFQEQGLELREIDVQRMAAFLFELKNRIRPETSELVLADVMVHRVERVLNSCVMDVPEMIDLNSGWRYVTEDRVSPNGPTLDEVVQMVLGGEEEEEDYDDDDAVSDLMPLINIPSVKFDGAGDDTCSICLDEFSDGNEVVRTSCSHNFHPDCIGTWMRRKRNSPICRARIHI